MKEIKLFRLVTGQDIIATLVETTDIVYKIEKALMIQLNQSGASLQVGLIPISISVVGYFDDQVNDEPPNLDLNRGCVLFTYNPAPEIERNYTQVTGTIQIAQRIPGKP